MSVTATQRQAQDARILQSANEESSVVVHQKQTQQVSVDNEKVEPPKITAKSGSPSHKTDRFVAEFKSDANVEVDLQGPPTFTGAKGLVPPTVNVSVNTTRNQQNDVSLRREDGSTEVAATQKTRTQINIQGEVETPSVGETKAAVQDPVFAAVDTALQGSRVFVPKAGIDAIVNQLGQDGKITDGDVRKLEDNFQQRVDSGELRQGDADRYLNQVKGDIVYRANNGELADGVQLEAEFLEVPARWTQLHPQAVRTTQDFRNELKGMDLKNLDSAAYENVVHNYVQKFSVDNSDNGAPIWSLNNIKNHTRAEMTAQGVPLETIDATMEKLGNLFLQEAQNRNSSLAPATQEYATTMFGEEGGLSKLVASQKDALSKGQGVNQLINGIIDSGSTPQSIDEVAVKLKEMHDAGHLNYDTYAAIVGQLNDYFRSQALGAQVANGDDRFGRVDAPAPSLIGATSATKFLETAAADGKVSEREIKAARKQFGDEADKYLRQQVESQPTEWSKADSIAYQLPPAVVGMLKKEFEVESQLDGVDELEARQRSELPPSPEPQTLTFDISVALDSEQSVTASLS